MFLFVLLVGVVTGAVLAPFIIKWVTAISDKPDEIPDEKADITDERWTGCGVHDDGLTCCFDPSHSGVIEFQVSRSSYVSKMSTLMKPDEERDIRATLSQLPMAKLYTDTIVKLVCCGGEEYPLLGVLPNYIVVAGFAGPSHDSVGPVLFFSEDHCYLPPPSPISMGGLVVNRKLVKSIRHYCVGISEVGPPKPSKHFWLNGTEVFVRPTSHFFAGKVTPATVFKNPIPTIETKESRHLASLQENCRLALVKQPSPYEQELKLYPMKKSSYPGYKAEVEYFKFIIPEIVIWDQPKYFLKEDLKGIPNYKQSGPGNLFIGEYKNLLVGREMARTIIRGFVDRTYGAQTSLSPPVETWSQRGGDHCRPLLSTFHLGAVWDGVGCSMIPPNTVVGRATHVSGPNRWNDGPNDEPWRYIARPIVATNNHIVSSHRKCDCSFPEGHTHQPHKGVKIDGPANLGLLKLWYRTTESEIKVDKMITKDGSPVLYESGAHVEGHFQRGVSFSFFEGNLRMEEGWFDVYDCNISHRELAKQFGSRAGNWAANYNAVAPFYIHGKSMVIVRRPLPGLCPFCDHRFSSIASPFQVKPEGRVLQVKGWPEMLTQDGTLIEMELVPDSPLASSLPEDIHTVFGRTGLFSHRSEVYLYQSRATGSRWLCLWVLAGCQSPNSGAPKFISEWFKSWNGSGRIKTARLGKKLALTIIDSNPGAGEMVTITPPETTQDDTKDNLAPPTEQVASQKDWWDVNPTDVQGPCFLDCLRGIDHPKLTIRSFLEYISKGPRPSREQILKGWFNEEEIGGWLSTFGYQLLRIVEGNDDVITVTLPRWKKEEPALLMTNSPTNVHWHTPVFYERGWALINPLAAPEEGDPDFDPEVSTSESTVKPRPSVRVQLRLKATEGAPMRVSRRRKVKVSDRESLRRIKEERRRLRYETWCETWEAHIGTLGQCVGPTRFKKWLDEAEHILVRLREDKPPMATLPELPDQMPRSTKSFASGSSTSSVIFAKFENLGDMVGVEGTRSQVREHKRQLIKRKVEGSLHHTDEEFLGECIEGGQCVFLADLIHGDRPKEKKGSNYIPSNKKGFLEDWDEMFGFEPEISNPWMLKDGTKDPDYRVLIPRLKCYPSSLKDETWLYFYEYDEARLEVGSIKQH